MTTAITTRHNMGRMGAHIQHIKNDNFAPLSMQQLRDRLPAVFATQARDDCSARYGFASTAMILQTMEKEGFVPVQASYNMRRNPADLPFTKHMLRLQRVGDAVRMRKHGDAAVPEVIMLNSHDRSGLLKLYAGMTVFACANGIIVTTQDFIEPVVVRHTNRIIEDVMAKLPRISAEAGRVTSIIDRMTSIKLSAKQQLAFASSAVDLRFGNGTARGSLDPAGLLVPRRVEDGAPDLWHVFNRVQENMIKGGTNSTNANGRTSQTREVVSINANLHINAGLWELAMATINKAKASSKGAK